jgi:hypothetical protein
MFLTITVAIVLGFLVILVMKRVPTALPQAQDGANSDPDHALLPSALTGERFEWLCHRLLQELGLDVVRTVMTGPRQLEAMAINPAPIVGGLYVVHGQLLQADEVVEAVDVLALLDAVKGEGASKGVLLTNRVFSLEANQAAANGPIELIDGARLRELLERFEVLPASGEELRPDRDGQARF